MTPLLAVRPKDQLGFKDRNDKYNAVAEQAFYEENCGEMNSGVLRFIKTLLKFPQKQRQCLRESQHEFDDTI